MLDQRTVIVEVNFPIYDYISYYFQLPDMLQSTKSNITLRIHESSS